jgi:hypothetical protein
MLSYLLYEGRPATTKGKWFNPVTFRYLRYCSGTRVISGSEGPVFITGTGRSGSTILGLILSMHKDIGFLNEPKALWHVVCPEGDLTGSYSKSKVMFDLDENDLRPGMPQKVKAMYSSYMRLTGSKVIVDKYPEMIYRTDFISRIFKNPRFLFLYRNPWDTIISTAQWSDSNRKVANGETEDWWGVNNRKWELLVEQVVPLDPYLSLYRDEIAKLDNQYDMAAVEWIVTMNRGLQAIEHHPDKFFPVSYEDLVEQPRQVLHRLFQFLGLRTDPVVLKYAVSELKYKPPRKKIDIHPMLREALSETSVRLGYGTQSPEMSVTE